MRLASSQQLQRLNVPHVDILTTRVDVVDTARDSGVIIDSRLSLSAQVAALCRSGYFQLRQLHPIICSLTMEAAKTIAQAFISCHLDYCNSLLYGISDSLIQCLQSLARGGVIISPQFFVSCTSYQSASEFISRLPAGFSMYRPTKHPPTLPTMPPDIRLGPTQTPLF